jgi:hypothetical protein
MKDQVIIQVIVVLCEGPHDVAFLRKILKTIGFESGDSIKIKDYPSPMNSIIPTALKQADIEELNIGQIGRGSRPTSLLVKNNVYLFLYSMGGDGKKEERRKFAQGIKNSIWQPGQIKAGRRDNVIGIIYFFDADTKGISARLKNITLEIDVALDVKGEVFENASFFKHENVKYGAYIFAKQDADNGKLEDILLPLMNQGNELIFEGANHYLDQHYDESRLYPLKIELVKDQIEEIRSNKNKEKYKHDRSKSLIGIVGQLQKSGSPNTAHISDTDYLTLEKIRANSKCQEITKFFQDFIDFS